MCGCRLQHWDPLMEVVSCTIKHTCKYTNVNKTHCVVFKWTPNCSLQPYINRDSVARLPCPACEVVMAWTVRRPEAVVTTMICWVAGRPAPCGFVITMVCCLLGGFLFTVTMLEGTVFIVVSTFWPLAETTHLHCRSPPALLLLNALLHLSSPHYKFPDISIYYLSN